MGLTNKRNLDNDLLRSKTGKRFKHEKTTIKDVSNETMG
jgi:hypothetical protein